MADSWKQVLYGADYLADNEAWNKFFTFAQNCNATHVNMEFLVIGNGTFPPVDNPIPYQFPKYGSTTITWFKNIVTDVVANYNVTNPEDIFNVTLSTNDDVLP